MFAQFFNRRAQKTARKDFINSETDIPWAIGCLDVGDTDPYVLTGKTPIETLVFNYKEDEYRTDTNDAHALDALNNAIRGTNGFKKLSVTHTDTALYALGRTLLNENDQFPLNQKIDRFVLLQNLLKDNYGYTEAPMSQRANAIELWANHLPDFIDPKSAADIVQLTEEPRLKLAKQAMEAIETMLENDSFRRTEKHAPLNALCKTAEIVPYCALATMYLQSVSQNMAAENIKNIDTTNMITQLINVTKTLCNPAFLSQLTLEDIGNVDQALDFLQDTYHLDPHASHKEKLTHNGQQCLTATLATIKAAQNYIKTSTRRCHTKTHINEKREALNAALEELEQAERNKHMAQLTPCAIGESEENNDGAGPNTPIPAPA